MSVEVSLLFGALAIAMIRDAMRRDTSGPDRVGMVIAGLGAIMMAIGGRFPPLPGDVDPSATVMAGIWVMIGGLALRLLGSAALFIHKLSRSGRTKYLK